MMQRFLEGGQPEWHGDHVGDDVPLLVGEIGGVGSAVRAVRHAHAARKTTSDAGGPRNPWNTLYVYNDKVVAISPAERANGTTTIEYLEYLRAAYPDDRIRVVWDGASYHRSEDVIERARELRILLTPLPAYSPDFMPVEALWRWMREEVTYNHCHATAADLIAGVSAFDHMVNQDPQTVFERLHVRTHLDPNQEKLRLS
jgi:transposase